MKYLQPILTKILSRKIGEILVSMNHITNEDLQEALIIQRKTKEKIGQILVNQGKITEEILRNALRQQIQIVPHFEDEKEAIEYLESIGINKRDLIERIEAYFGVVHVELWNRKIDNKLFEIFNFEELQKEDVLPYRIDDDSKTIYFAINEITASNKKQFFSEACLQKGYKAKFNFAFLHEIREKFHQVLAPTIRFDENGEDSVEFVNSILNKGISLNASDIHFEPREGFLQIRYRVDGFLSIKDTYSFGPDQVASIISRIKIISNMNIAEKRRPQDGRLDNYPYGDQLYDIRVSTAPTIYGEKVVMRIFNKTSRIMTFNELGFSEKNADLIKSMLKSSNGIIYLAGATGSGKTTTLYTMIDYINSDNINIYTIEDPVEKSLNNINQIQVDPKSGVTFANTLRSLLRQDPDVIVVGEIRDHETAELSVRGSLTGHLVLATIHANNAIDTINRLYNMDIEPYLLGASTLGIISQRLVRRLCSCKELTEPTGPEKAWIKSVQDRFGINEEIKVYKPVGCSKCEGIGYKGRIAIAEVLNIADDRMRELIAKKNIKELRMYAIEKGFETIDLSAYEKVRDGITSPREVMTVL